jgi:hypothetical protein
MNTLSSKLRRGLAHTLIAGMVLAPLPAFASSHQDAPLITLDPAANTTDVYAFVDEDNGQKNLVVALGVYPHENAGVGPNKYGFDDNVRYEIALSLGNNISAGLPSIIYRFEFKTSFKHTDTILQAYTGVVQDVDDANQNLTQRYTVTKIDLRNRTDQVLGTGVVPPNNQGNATPFYNQGNNGENQARKGVATEGELDKYTKEAITELSNGYEGFAGQRDDGFYADIQSIFDLLKLRNPGKDSQGGFNLHFMSLEIPVSELGGDSQVVGVYATTSRQSVPVVNPSRSFPFNIPQRQFVQVARQGNPLFNEGLVALEDKDLYSRSSPSVDNAIFRKYAENPELARLINLLIGGGQQLAIPTGRTDIASIFIPDMIKVDLSTSGVRFAGNGAGDASNPDDPGFSRLSIFGGDVLKSRIQDPFKNGGFIPGGWPNGRRFGDDVVDIAVIALLSDLRDPNKLVINDPFKGNYDGVTSNDMGFNKVFPYESTPQNARNHQ